jgi:hypothetical protein
VFRLFIVDLCNVNSQISLAKLIEDKPYTSLNWATVRLYHQLYGTGK